jgi:hypothetical protein
VIVGDCLCNGSVTGFFVLQVHRLKQTDTYELQGLAPRLLKADGSVDVITTNTVSMVSDPQWSPFRRVEIRHFPEGMMWCYIQRSLTYDTYTYPPPL